MQTYLQTLTTNHTQVTLTYLSQLSITAHGQLALVCY